MKIILLALFVAGGISNAQTKLENAHAGIAPAKSEV